MHARLTFSRVALATVACSVSGITHAQCSNPELLNSSFEVASPGSSTTPDQWGVFNTARLRNVSDGIMPFFARTGDGSVEFPSGTDFSGITTNVLNPSTLTFNDPSYVYLGGDVTVTGWYLIPEDMPLEGASSGIKLEFRRQNSSIYAAFEDLSVTGDTAGQWVEYSFTVTDDDMLAVGDFPPYAVAVTVLPLRFGDTTSTGTVFWDDLCIVQAEETDCPADVNGDGDVNPADFNAWVIAFNNQAPECDQNGDGFCNPADFNAWVLNFNNGC
ncbi:MAG: GC-type dockerin domain-anchored protein [Planctomycetota bacterium]